MGAGRQDLDFRHPVEQVVIGLAHHRRRDIGPFAGAHHLGNAPAAEIRQAEVADLPLPHQVAQRAHRLVQVFLVEVAVQVEDVDVVGAEPAQAVLGFPHDPLARIVRLVGLAAHCIAQLGGQHPVVALACQQPPDHQFGCALGVDIGGIDEVDAVVPRRGDDAAGFGLVGLIAKHHGAQA